MNGNDLTLAYASRLYVNKKTIYFAFKRIFDIFVGIIGIMFMIPVVLLIKVLYMLNGDFNSIFFKQERVGKDSKPFMMYKFRTMVPNADEKLNELLKSDSNARKEYAKYKKLNNDPRVTKIGSLLRKTSVDELPQLINVFKGDMSLIGNRPYLPREKSDMKNYYLDIVSTKPGVTGYWQVNGRSKVEFKDRLKLESYYSKNSSLKMDVKIFLKTFSTVFNRIGAK